MEPIGRPKSRQETTILRRVKSHKNADLITFKFSKAPKQPLGPTEAEVQ